MKKRIQILLLLILIGTLICLLGLRFGAERASEKAAGPEAPEIHPPVPDVYPLEPDSSRSPYPDTTKSRTGPAGAPEAPVETPELEIIAGRAMTEATPLLLDSVPLDARTQWSIYELCGGDNSLFAAVMAIANRESHFASDAIGDEGRCVGMMQINYAFHTERIDRLGVTDLLDPVQSAAVAVDYIDELGQEFGVTEDSHILYSRHT